MRREVLNVFQTVGFDKFIPISTAESSAQKIFAASDENFSFKSFLADKVSRHGEKIAICAGENYIYIW